MLVHARQNTHSCSSSSSSTCDGSSFQHFCQAWIVRERSYMDKLLFLSYSHNHPQQEEELKSLIGEVLSHHQSYYEAKSKAAQRDVFFLFCPSWFSTLERSFLWITGFRPSLAFKTLDKSIGSELTAQQVEKVQILKLETRAIEKMLSDEMIGIQESIVGPTWMQVVRRMEGQVMDGDMDQVIEMVKDRLRKLVASADLLRTKTATEIVEILNPVQAAKFLAASARLQLKVGVIVILENNPPQNLSAVGRVLWRFLAKATTWGIWKERNARMFDEFSCPADVELVFGRKCSQTC